MLAKSGLSDRVGSFTESGRVPVARGFGIPIAYLVTDQLSAPKQQKKGEKFNDSHGKPDKWLRGNLAFWMLGLGG